eukprot:gb/GECH01014110.1/.p1 GENE.gb/GECH01014110.1/~~gb/GECH01014110.1/.p1  ORF type:complete len:348 (+),score=119.25 gb/GECH01014110.1/:1-1044(+)
MHIENENKTDSKENKDVCTFIRRGSRNRRKKNLKTKRNIDEISNNTGEEDDKEADQRQDLEEVQRSVKKRRLATHDNHSDDKNMNQIHSAEGNHAYAANRGLSDSKQRAQELSTSERQTDGPQSQKKRSSYIHGPVKQNTNIRTVTYYDYQPDICKDYKETGYCGYGDNCKFAHIREDYKSGWMLDRDFEEKQKRRKEQIEKGLSIENNDSESDSEDDSDSDDEDLPFACYLCREEFQDPVVTTCGHYFCSACIMKEYQSGHTKCPVCLEPTNGIFNTAEKIIEKQKKAENKRNQKKNPEDEFEREAKLFSKVEAFEKENQQFRPSASDWMIPSDFEDQRKGGSAGL